jgi:hypothetical protein
MKKYLFIVILLLIIALISMGFIISRLNSKLEIANNNIKSLQNNKIELLQTVDQLKTDTTRIGQEFNKILDSLNIKPKKVVEYKYLKSKSSRIDTIHLVDTVFVEGFCLDTIISSGEWYNLNISMSYPGDFIVNPSFTSEKYIISHKKRETVNPPKKFFLFRWFQKKHTIIEIEIIEKNPYIKTEDYKYVEIL